MPAVNRTRAQPPTRAIGRHSALAVWLLPWAGVTASYVLSASADLVPTCLPYLEGCTSVSATGRDGLGYFLFKGTMIPTALLGCVYWWAVTDWASTANSTASPIDRAILWAGGLGSLALLLYTIFLGGEGDAYRMMRRYGTVAYFGLTFLAELLLTTRAHTALPGSRLVLSQWVLCLGMLVVGAALGVTTYLVEGLDAVQNATEWWMASALTAYPLVTWLIWRTRGSGDRPDT